MTLEEHIVQISECKINVYPDALPELTLDAAVLETVRVESEVNNENT